MVFLPLARSAGRLPLLRIDNFGRGFSSFEGLLAGQRLAWRMAAAAAAATSPPSLHRTFSSYSGDNSDNVSAELLGERGNAAISAKAGKLGINNGGASEKLPRQKQQPAKMTLEKMREKYTTGSKIKFVTAHDYPTGVLAERANVDAILVGDSLGMVALGYASTVSVTMDEMIHHAKAVKRGAPKTLLVGDLPFGSVNISTRQALTNAIRFIQEAGMDAVKMEGGAEMAKVVQHFSLNGIVTFGHVGLTPQRVSAQSGYKVQGKLASMAIQVLNDALALQNAGAVGVILEAIPHQLAKLITARLSIPTIGIGAGPDTSGQILVMADMIGLIPQAHVPKFCKTFANVGTTAISAIETYCEEIDNGSFPAKENQFSMEEGEFNELLRMVDKALGKKEE